MRFLERLKTLAKFGGLVATCAVLFCSAGCVTADKQFGETVQGSLSDIFDPAVDCQFDNGTLSDAEKQKIRIERRALQLAINAITGEEYELPAYCIDPD